MRRRCTSGSVGGRRPRPHRDQLRSTASPGRPAQQLRDSARRDKRRVRSRLRSSTSSSARGDCGMSVNRIAGVREVVQQGEHARRHVEPDRIAGAAGGAGIVRHQDRDAALARAASACRRDHRGDALRHLLDAVRLRPVGEAP